MHKDYPFLGSVVVDSVKCGGTAVIQPGGIGKEAHMLRACSDGVGLEDG